MLYIDISKRLLLYKIFGFFLPLVRKNTSQSKLKLIQHTTKPVVVMFLIVVAISRNLTNLS